MAWQQRGGGFRPSKHNHAGQMIFEDDRCYCDSCGQTWRMDRSYDKMGKLLCKWVPLPRSA